MPSGDGALERAFESLKGYEWGQDPAALKAIDDALLASSPSRASGGASASPARDELEARLCAILESDAPRAARDQVCRRLSLIGSAASVPFLEALLVDEDLSHMARYALERFPCLEAGAALRRSLSRGRGRCRVGVIRSLGERREPESVPHLAALLGDSDPETVEAAITALGRIGTAAAARALGERVPERLAGAAADARLECSERLLEAGEKEAAAAIYEAIRSAPLPEHIRLAASRGLRIGSDPR